MNIPELMTVAEFLTRYSISRTHFYREVGRGTIPLRKLGTASRIARADAEAWAKSLPIREGASS